MLELLIIGLLIASIVVCVWASNLSRRIDHTNALLSAILDAQTRQSLPQPLPTAEPEAPAYR